MVVTRRRALMLAGSAMVALPLLGACDLSEGGATEGSSGALLLEAVSPPARVKSS